MSDPKLLVPFLTVALSDGARPLRDRLRENYAYLSDELKVSCYVNDVFEAKVLSRQDKDELSDLASSRRKQAEAFLDTMMSKPESSIRKFFDVVRTQKDKQPQIYEHLFPEHTSIEQYERTQQINCSNANLGESSCSSAMAMMEDLKGEELLIPQSAGVGAAVALHPTLLLLFDRSAFSVPPSTSSYNLSR